MQSDKWQTPLWIIRRIEKEFGAIYLDPCASSNTVDHFAQVNLVKALNGGLEIAWANYMPHITHPLHKWIVFVNPPYSSPKSWCEKAVEECAHGAHIVLLMPNSTDTEWWQILMRRATQIIFLIGRVNFNYEGAPGAYTAPCGSAIIELNPKGRTREDHIRFEDWRVGFHHPV